MSETYFRLPILVGPTGVGKSEVAYLLAKKMNAEILSADAYQAYQGFEIGTSQPPREWQREVPHHLVGHRDPQKSWNAVEFAREAVQIIKTLTERSKPAIVVGGAGFYIRALVDGPPPSRGSRPEIRAWVMERARELGVEKTHEWLGERNSEAAKRLHPNDRKRVYRALELTFEPESAVEDYRPLGKSNVLFLGLERSRDKLDEILKERTRLMWERGLLAETERMLELELPAQHPLWGAIGYAEALGFRKGGWSESEAKERIFRRTRQYAKRQWTWFKHQHETKWFNLDPFDSLPNFVDFLMKEITT